MVAVETALNEREASPLLLGGFRQFWLAADLCPGAGNGEGGGVGVASVSCFLICVCVRW